MKIKLLGGGSFYGPYGVMVSYGPNSEIDIDDDEPSAVAYWQERVDSGAAELIVAPAKGAAASTSEAPPKAGAGSSRDAWAIYAVSLGVDVTADMSRDDIVEAVEDKS